MGFLDIFKKKPKDGSWTNFPSYEQPEEVEFLCRRILSPDYIFCQDDGFYDWWYNTRTNLFTKIWSANRYYCFASRARNEEETEEFKTIWDNSQPSKPTAIALATKRQEPMTPLGQYINSFLVDMPYTPKSYNHVVDAVLENLQGPCWTYVRTEKNYHYFVHQENKDIWILVSVNPFHIMARDTILVVNQDGKTLDALNYRPSFQSWEKFTNSFKVQTSSLADEMQRVKANYSPWS